MHLKGYSSTGGIDWVVVHAERIDLWQNLKDIRRARSARVVKRGGGSGTKLQTQGQLYCILDFCKSETHQPVFL